MTPLIEAFLSNSLDTESTFSATITTVSSFFFPFPFYMLTRSHQTIVFHFSPYWASSFLSPTVSFTTYKIILFAFLFPTHLTALSLASFWPIYPFRLHWAYPNHINNNDISDIFLISFLANSKLLKPSHFLHCFLLSKNGLYIPH